MKQKVFIKLLPLFFIQLVHAQKQTTTAQQVWLSYLTQIRITSKWGFNADASIRTKERFFNNFSQGVLRTGLMYYLSDKENLAAGYAYFHYYPGENHPNVAQTEHRLWQQLQWNTNYSKLRLQQRIRLEERYRRKLVNGELADGYNFNYRTRMNVMLYIPLGKKDFSPKTFSFFIGDEAMLNFGKEIVYNTFDQNRALAGFNYIFDNRHNIQFGYMHILQQQSSGNKYKSTHVVRIYYFHTIDLRKTKTPVPVHLPSSED